jgi:putative copper export protein
MEALDDLMGFYLMPIFSPVISERRAESLSSSCALVEYISQPTSVVFSLSEAFGQRLKSLFSNEYLALSIKTENGRDWARITLHQLIPSSSLGDNRKKYFFKT